MKRIIEESVEYETLKPVFGTRADAPFYDPNDLHVHNWYYGKLGIEEDPKVPTFSKSKMFLKNCTYCKVCHKIKLEFQSTVSNNKDIVSDTLYDVFDSKFTEDYIPSTNQLIEINIKQITDSDKHVKTGEISENLFIKTDGIYNDYVVVKEN